MTVAIGSMQRPPRVLLVCDWFLRYVVPYAIALHERGVDVALLCRDHAHEFNGSATEREHLLAGLDRAGVSVFEIPGRVRSLRAVRASVDVAAAVRRFRPDVVHAQSEIHDPRLLAAVTGYPTVLTVHDPELHWGTPRRPLHLRVIQWAWRRRADVLLVHGEALANELADRLPVAVVPHGTKVRSAPLPVPDRPAVLFFGRLEPYKGIPVLLEAMQDVWSRRPEARLLVGGEGSEIDAIPADPRIEAFLGYVPESRVEDLFRRASLVVLPYVDGSQSGVGLAAVGRGVPVVVTRVGALTELAVDESFVVPPRDPSALARAILAHLDDGPDVRAAVLEHGRRNFGWSAVARRAAFVLAEVARSSGDASAARA